MNDLLYGHDPSEGILAAQLLNDGQIRVYSRVNGKSFHNDVEFFPFLFLSDPALLQGFDRKHWMKELSGSNFYRFLAVFTRWTDMWNAVRLSIERYQAQTKEDIGGYPEAHFLHVRPDPVSQYFMQSGKTLFKGMVFEDLRRMQIRFFAHRSGRVNDPRKTEDRIQALALSDTTGWSEVLDGRKLDEPALLRRLNAVVSERDPDVIEGHNLLGHDLPYLKQRYALHQIAPVLGRDEAELKQLPAVRSTGFDADPDGGSFDLPGRHLVDTQLLGETYDFSKRTLESMDLSSMAAQFSGDADRPSAILSPQIWSERPREVIRTLEQNTGDIQLISNHLLPGSFYLSQMVPLSFGMIARGGSAAKIEALMVREYLRRKHSIPRPEQGTQTTGGYADIFMTGIFEHILHADVESLYPSIILARGIRPSTDELSIFDKLLQDLVRMRLEAKQSMANSTQQDRRNRFDALQSSFKILINSFYGYLGYMRGLFNDYSKADEITKSGQALLKNIVRQIGLYNGRVLEADTDGVFFVTPDNVVGEEQETALVDRISESLPQGIRLVSAGRFRKMMSYKKKNYALLDYDGSLVIRGSSLISRSMERFLRRYLRLAISNLLDGNFEGLHSLYISFHNDITSHHWESVDFCRTETIHDPFSVYEREVGERKRNPAAVYEVARLAGRLVRPGDRVSYYVTGSSAGVKISEHCRLAEEWDPNFPDENTLYYLSRLEEATAKFDVFFTPEDFRKIFTVEDLFGFDPAGVSVLQKPVASEEQDPSAPNERDLAEFRIWLGEE